jgi:hypothetical protein
MKLVMIHGRAQGGRNPVTVKKEWLDALTYGCARATVELPKATTVEFPYFGDDLDRLVAQLDVPLGSDANAKGTANDAERGFRGDMLEDLARNVGLTRADVEREYAGSPVQKGVENWEWVQAILRAVDRVPGVNSATIDLLTRDVFAYLSYPGVRAKIDAIVAASIGSEPCVVLAHSLGTIVAYNVLGKRDPRPEVLRLVTVGSPLGIRAIKQHLAAPLGSPPCVGNWFNAYDDRDVVALVPLDTKNFDVAPPIENKSDVMNFTDNRHGIAGYLADPVVAAKIVEYL